MLPYITTFTWQSQALHNLIFSFSCDIITITKNLKGDFFMSLQEKLRCLEENYPEIYAVLCNNLPNLVANPSSPSAEDLDEYNFWIDAITDDIAYQLYHKL